MSQDPPTTGIRAVNSGPLVIRTYNDQSANTTYVVRKYEYPVSSNYVLITSSGGQLVPSDTIYVSSITASTMSMNRGFFSSLTGLYAAVSTISTTTVAVASSITTSSLVTINSNSNYLINTSTLLGSTIVASSVVSVTSNTNFLISNSTIIGSSLVATTVSLSSLTVSSLFSGYSNSNFLVNNSTITGSSLVATTVSLSSLTVSSLFSGYSNNNFLVNNSTMTGSSIGCNVLRVSTVVTSTITVALLTTQGTVYSNNGVLTNTNPSDASLKTNIIPLIASVDNLRPVQFHWSNPLHNAVPVYGFLADEVQTVFPNIVSTWTDTDGSSKLGYDPVSLIPVLVSAVQQQNTVISTLQQQIIALQSSYH